MEDSPFIFYSIPLNIHHNAQFEHREVACFHSGKWIWSQWKAPWDLSVRYAADCTWEVEDGSSSAFPESL